MPSTTPQGPRRIGQWLYLKAESIDAYKECHAAVWPEVLEQIKDSNISDCKSTPSLLAIFFLQPTMSHPLPHIYALTYHHSTLPTSIIPRKYMQILLFAFIVSCATRLFSLIPRTHHQANRFPHCSLRYAILLSLIPLTISHLNSCSPQWIRFTVHFYLPQLFIAFSPQRPKHSLSPLPISNNPQRPVSSHSLSNPPLRFNLPLPPPSPHALRLLQIHRSVLRRRYGPHGRQPQGAGMVGHDGWHAGVAD